jgi:hypothetical protein
MIKKHNLKVISYVLIFRSRGFFFNSARDHEKSSIDDLDIMTRMQLDYVGFWLQYEYEENVGGTLSLGLNGSPFSSVSNYKSEIV